MEIDFPRVDPTELKKERKRRKFATDVNGAKRQKKASFRSGGQLNSEHAGIWTRPMTIAWLAEGVLGLGVVREISETEVLLECANGLIVQLPVENCGAGLLKTLSSSSLQLDDVFKIGQMLSFKVLKPAAPKQAGEKKVKRTYPVVSCDPSYVNLHINPGKLSNGLVLIGAVESVEDKGIARSSSEILSLCLPFVLLLLFLRKL